MRNTAQHYMCQRKQVYSTDNNLIDRCFDKPGNRFLYKLKFKREIAPCVCHIDKVDSPVEFQGDSLSLFHA